MRERVHAPPVVGIRQLDEVAGPVGQNRDAALGRHRDFRHRVAVVAIGGGLPGPPVGLAGAQYFALSDSRSKKSGVGSLMAWSLLQPFIVRFKHRVAADQSSKRGHETTMAHYDIRT